jgi:hypothetical protein
MTINDLNKYNEVNYKYYYYPLWENSEFEIFIHHFGLKDLFDTSEGFVLEMGSKYLKKTEVFGKSPRILNSYNINGVFRELIEAVKSGRLNKYISSLSSISDPTNANIDDVIHRIFFMKPSDDYESYNVIIASDYFLCFISRQFDYIRINQASTLYYSASSPILRGIYFETYFHTYILKTMKGCVVNLKGKYTIDDENEFQFENFPERKCSFEVSKYNRTDEIVNFDLQSDEYYCPKTYLDMSKVNFFFDICQRKI